VIGKAEVHSQQMVSTFNPIAVCYARFGIGRKLKTAQRTPRLGYACVVTRDPNSAAYKGGKGGRTIIIPAWIIAMIDVDPTFRTR